MDKSMLQTATVIIMIIASAWLIGGEVKSNSARLDGLRDDMRELRGLLIGHISEHGHALTIVKEGPNNAVKRASAQRFI